MSRGELDAAADRVAARLDELVRQASAAALRVRDRGPDAARFGLPEDLLLRLEGAGTLRDNAFEAWVGTPEEPGTYPAGGGARVVTRGMRTSLLATSPANAGGRRGAVSFVLDIRSGAVRATDLLPASDAGIAARWDVSRPPESATAAFDPGPPASLVRPWRDPGGNAAGAIVLEERPASMRASRSWGEARAWGGFAIALLAALALIRPRRAMDGARLVAVAAGVLAARVALAWGRTLEELLPRALGSASVYGRGDALGLLGSPAALATTALGVSIVMTAVSRWSARTSPRARPAVAALTGAAAVVGIAGTVALAASLARDARVKVPRIDLGDPAGLLLALSLAWLVAGTSRAVAALVAPGRRRTAIAAALVVLATVAAVQLRRDADRLVDERLRSEFAPLVLEQSARRQLALTAAVSQTAAAPEVAEALAGAVGTGFVAFDAWIASDLFHQGFASSLDLYDASGLRRDHFGFAFPPVGGERESAPRAAAPGGAPVVEAETLPAGASLLRVVHAEAPVLDASGRTVGRVVGHVLEDPSNLPFLPGNAPYIEALGRGAPRLDDPAAEPPDYVVYDEDSRVDVSTVHRPPAVTAQLRAAAGAGRRVDVDAGDQRYRALPLAEGGRLHLLMSPSPTWIDALADVVRLVMLGLAILAVGALATLAAAGGAPAILDLVRGSFYRKLLAAVLVSSVVPLVVCAVFVRAYIERRASANLADAAAGVVGAARRVVEDYQSVGEDDPTVPPLRINDEALSWLRRVVGQEIHVFEGGVMVATSKPELFDSGLLPKRLPGEVDRAIVREGQPFVVRRERLGATSLPVAYARVDVRSGPRDSVIAVPLVIEEREFARSVERLIEMLLLLTAALVSLLAASSALLARTVAGPVRRLADASRRIAGGDYGARLESTSRDEMGTLVSDFNRMAGALESQRSDLMRRRDYIEALLRHATTGVLSTDPAGRVVTINPAAEALLASPSGPPRPGDLLVETLSRNRAQAPLAAALADDAGTAEAPAEVDVGRGEAMARLRIVRVPLPDAAGGTIGSLVLIDDVTSLMKSNQLAAWAEMARAIAHEIKNPLTPIQLSAEHARKLLRDRGVLPSPEIDACLDTIVRQVRELREISRAFSTYAKIPDLTLERVSPEAFMREVAAPYRAAPPPGIRLRESYDGAPDVMADRRILARAVVNLIENALEAMPRGGTLSLGVRPSGDGGATLDVTDDGAGLAPEVRARLFEPYFSTKTSGTGLGLAIVRRVVAGHGGTIEVLDPPGGGSTFRIRLPAAILRA
ncbi:MAG TPA: ATP-binding protein [Candidatus Polarisedimenticolaceae bacterium]|nr:ATP-binding protein [Candidatus Polarisedimenticolaceae bacterium]